MKEAKHKILSKTLKRLKNETVLVEGINCERENKYKKVLDKIKHKGDNNLLLEKGRYWWREWIWESEIVLVRKGQRYWEISIILPNSNEM